MFFNVLGSVATFITGTLAGLLIGKSGSNETAAAPINFNETSFKEEELSENILEEGTEIESEGKYDGEMPEETEIDEDWDKD
jgi:hypothetical protein